MSAAAVDAWIAKAREKPLLDALGIAAPAHAVKRRSGGETMGPCPRCGGKHKDEFAISADGKWLCRKSAEGGHDAIGLAMHVANLEFLPAVELLAGEPRPGKPLSDEEVAALDARRREREREAEEKRERAREEAERERRLKQEKAESLWEMGKPIEGTPVAAYLEARAIKPHPSWTFDLRFAMVDYFGQDERGQPKEFGLFPCMLGAIRNVDAALIGVHRTYIDPEQPAKLALPPPNKAKKILGGHKGGLIRLSEIRRRMAIGEGIETTRSAWCLGFLGEDCGIAAAVSIGNMAGGATGTLPHPTLLDDRGKPKRIPNGEPDHERPGIILPDDVEEVVFLGDGDSEPLWTGGQIVVAARRQRDLERIALVAMADKDRDFNDMLRAT